MRKLTWGVALLSAALAAGAAEKQTVDKAALEKYVRHLLLWGPEIQVEISDPEPSELEGFRLIRVKGSAGHASREEVFYLSRDGKKLVRAAIYELDQNPFRETYEKITTDGQPSLGTPGAPVRLVVFTDFQCPYCKKEAESLRKNLLKAYPKEVRLYFKDFPLDPIHPWARDAAIAGRCVYKQSEESFWKYHDWVFAHQSEITKANFREKVVEFAGTLPDVDQLRFTRCIDNRETEPEVNRSIAEGRELGINSTPTLFINGRKIPSQLPWPNLKQVIDMELEYQKTAQNAGDAACCAVKLPSPLNQ